MASRILKKGKNRITQGYKTSHLAVDLGREHITGEPIIAHSDGTVVFCQTGQKNNKGSTGNASYGNCVKIDHGNGYATLYAHLATVTVTKGQAVKCGEVIGTMGNTGNSYGMHLHFEVRKGASKVNPIPYLEADLPKTEEKAHAHYKVHTGKWLAEVTDCNNVGTDGYAGIHGKAMTALMVKASKGKIRYRVHLLKEKRWLPWVVDYTDHAGNIGQSIDAVQMELLAAPGYTVQYRVSPVSGKGWYGWCTGLSDATGDGYAGVFGKAVDCIQVKIVKK